MREAKQVPYGLKHDGSMNRLMYWEKVKGGKRGLVCQRSGKKSKIHTQE